ncbi:NUDIX hydrolase, partial [mine drainage metagenome]
ESLAGIARTGLGFTESLFERERYEEVLHIAADIAAAAQALRRSITSRSGTGDAGGTWKVRADENGKVTEAGVGVQEDAAGFEGGAADALVTEWMRSVGRGVAGYVTPKVAVGAVVGNDAGEILLIQRADSGIWLYPTGWADIGYSASEVVVKEVKEETGILVEPVRLIAV